MGRFCKFFVIGLLLLSTASFVVADDRGIQSSVPWQSPVTLGQGGSTAASARGVNALFSNPAGFIHPETFGARDKLGIHIGAQLWGNAFLFNYNDILELAGGSSDIFTGMADILNVMSGNISSMSGFLNNLFPALARGDFEAGLSLTAGYVNHGVGLGLRVGFITEGVEEGISASLEYTFVGGYAHTFSTGEFDLTIGADVRPFMHYRIGLEYSIFDHVESLFASLDSGDMGGVLAVGQNLMDDVEFVSGWGVGFDVGVTARYKSLTLGLQVRDVYTPVFYQRTYNIISGVNDFVEQNGFITDLTGGGDVQQSIIPTEISFGLMYDIPFKKEDLFDMRVHLQVADPFNLTDHFRAGDDLYNVFQVLSAGIELTFLSFLDIRGGINDGLLAFGFGLDLFALELHATVYDYQIGISGTENIHSKIALEIAVSF